MKILPSPIDPNKAVILDDDNNFLEEVDDIYNIKNELFDLLNLKKIFDKNRLVCNKELAIKFTSEIFDDCPPTLYLLTIETKRRIITLEGWSPDKMRLINITYEMPSFNK